MSEETRAAKHVMALAKRLGDQQILWAVPAGAVIDAETAWQRIEHDGLFASTGDELHFFRKGLFTSIHERLTAADVTEAEVVTGRLPEGERQVVMLHRAAAPAWGVFTDTDATHRFLLEKLAATT